MVQILPFASGVHALSVNFPDVLKLSEASTQAWRQRLARAKSGALPFSAKVLYLQKVPSYRQTSLFIASANSLPHSVLSDVLLGMLAIAKFKSSRTLSITRSRSVRGPQTSSLSKLSITWSSHCTSPYICTNWQYSQARFKRPIASYRAFVALGSVEIFKPSSI